MGGQCRATRALTGAAGCPLAGLEPWWPLRQRGGRARRGQVLEEAQLATLNAELSRLPERLDVRGKSKRGPVRFIKETITLDHTASCRGLENSSLPIKLNKIIIKAQQDLLDLTS